MDEPLTPRTAQHRQAAAPLDSPVMAEFMANLERINGLGDASPGFVWRLQGDDGNATGLEQPFGPGIIANLTVWQDVEALRAFVFRSEHVFVPAPAFGVVREADGPPTVLWWVAAGHRPPLARGQGAAAAAGRPGPDVRRVSPSRMRSPRTAQSLPPGSGGLAPWPTRSASWSSASATWAQQPRQGLPPAPGFEIVGLMSRTIGIRRRPAGARAAGYPRFEDFEQALRETRPDAVSINTYPNTHADYAIRAMDAGCHVFMEKPIATTDGGCRGGGRQGQGDAAQARARLHPARAPGLGEAGRDRPQASASRW